MAGEDRRPFRQKVEARRTGTEGLFVAINGFTGHAVSKNSYHTPLIFFDGNDLDYALSGTLQGVTGRRA